MGELSLLRREGSNLRPSGYEPDELPLLYFAMWGANVRQAVLRSKIKLNGFKNLATGPLAIAGRPLLQPLHKVWVANLCFNHARRFYGLWLK